MRFGGESMAVSAFQFKEESQTVRRLELVRWSQPALNGEETWL
jgi:hypothetical protein